VELSKLVKENIMTPMIKSLGDYTGTNGLSVVPGSSVGGGGAPMPSVGGGGGSATDGLGQIDTGSGTVRSALSTAASALGGGGGGVTTIGGQPNNYKKGGYVAKGGKINLGSGRVSTASKNKNCSNW
jgi:hypothetical protein